MPQQLAYPPCDDGRWAMLIGVAGRGWYQEEGKPAVEILPGTVIHIPANVKHWHGAAAAYVGSRISPLSFPEKTPLPNGSTP